MRRTAAAFALLSLLIASVALPHAGGLDRYGCHEEPGAAYHCHRAQIQSSRYSRVLYRHWVDEDGDCQDTRAEVLISESRVRAQLDADGCRVVTGRWFDPYTGQTFTDAKKLDVDHFVPLAEVHRSGGDRWTPEKRRAYANDLDHAETLIAVSLSANRSKGDKDPAQWLPPNAAYRCEYVRIWLAVKAEWGLLMDTAEAQAVRAVQDACPTN